MKSIIYLLRRKQTKSIAIICLFYINSFGQGAFNGYNILDTNNVRARILNGGDSFWDLTGLPGFEVPKGGGKHTIFTSSLWVGGIDGNGQLKIASQTYRQNGTDYWPGPLDTNYAPGTFNPAWDTVFKVNKSTILYHLQHFNDPGYVIPSSIATWPANGYPGTAPVLAPFIDLNGNQIYEPVIGEAPSILGDQACYAVFNDNHIPASSPNGDPLGIEVHTMHYEFVAPQDSILNNTVFVNYKIANRSILNYDSLYVGIYNDFDLGFYNDDFIQTNVGLDLVYAYNGDADDDLPSGYGTNPPVQGIVFLNQPLAHSTVFENNNNVPFGNPSGINDCYNYLTSTWRDGIPVTWGGIGYNPGSTDFTNLMYPGTTDPAHSGQSWTELIAGNQPGDRRTVCSTGPFTLAAGGYLDIDIAFVYARDTINSWPNGSITALENGVIQLRQLYNSGALSLADWGQKKQERMVVYPNPVSQSDKSVSVYVPTTEKIKLIITDISGKMVMEKNVQGNHVYKLSDVNFAKGTYIIQAVSQKMVYTSKLMVR